MTVWFITGASRGFGKIWARAALERGDQVAATARDISTLDDLVKDFGDRVLPLPLDVSDRSAAFAAVDAAHAKFGRLDVVVNNAGYPLFGFVEELDDDDVRAQLETNLLGMLRVTQAALPYMRKQGSGRIMNLSSVGGLLAMPMLGAYNASKFAIEGLSEALAHEVAPFGVKVTIIEPGAFATDGSGSSAKHSVDLEDYAARKQQVMEGFAQRVTSVAVPPETTAHVILALADSDDPPLRMFLGGSGLPRMKAAYAKRVEDWEQWQELAASAS